MIPPRSVWEKRNLGKWSGVQAQKAVFKALQEGRLKSQPCQVCKVSPAMAHHADYGKPMDVIFLCPKHHSNLHNRIAGLLRGDLTQQYTLSFHDEVLAAVGEAHINGTKLKPLPALPKKAASKPKRAIPPFQEGIASRLITKSELCEFLGCPPQYVQYEVSKGRLRQHKLSANMSRFAWQDVQDWLASKRV